MDIKPKYRIRYDYVASHYQSDDREPLYWYCNTMEEVRTRFAIIVDELRAVGGRGQYAEVDVFRTGRIVHNIYGYDEYIDADWETIDDKPLLYRLWDHVPREINGGVQPPVIDNVH